MRDVAEKMSEEIRTVNKMKEEDAGYVDLSAKIRDRFSRWHRAWWKVHQVTQIDGRPPLRQILDLASANVNNGHLREVALEARVHLEGIKP